MELKYRTGELRELSSANLENKLIESQEELFNLRFQMATGQLSNYKKLHLIRKKIARIFTILNERNLGLTLGPISKEI